MNNISKYIKNSLLLTVLLMIFSVYIIYDASSIWAQYKYNDSFYYLKRQIIYVILGFIILFFSRKINISFLKKYSFIFLLITLFLLILVVIPGVGINKGGSSSWLGFSFLSFQPSEIFKIAIIIFASKYLDLTFLKTASFKTIIPLLVVFLCGAILIMLQPDFGTLIVIFAAIVSMIFLSKLKFRYFIYSFVICLILFCVMIAIEPYRINRITAFIDPFSDPLGTGFQIIQSLYAIGPGGLVGEGINNSIQKYYYLPEPQTDFFYALIVEEFGLLGGLIILIIYLLLFYNLYKICKYSHSSFKYLLSFGFLSLMVVQVIINLGVVTSLFPVTGITLPFLSYGGSSLLSLCLCIGIITGDNDEYITC